MAAGAVASDGVVKTVWLAAALVGAVKTVWLAATGDPVTGVPATVGLATVDPVIGVPATWVDAEGQGRPVQALAAAAGDKPYPAPNALEQQLMEWENKNPNHTPTLRLTGLILLGFGVVLLAVAIAVAITIGTVLATALMFSSILVNTLAVILLRKKR